MDHLLARYRCHEVLLGPPGPCKKQTALQLLVVEGATIHELAKPTKVNKLRLHRSAANARSVEQTAWAGKTKW